MGKYPNGSPRLQATLFGISRLPQAVTNKGSIVKATKDSTKVIKRPITRKTPRTRRTHFQMVQLSSSLAMAGTLVELIARTKTSSLFPMKWTMRNGQSKQMDIDIR